MKFLQLINRIYYSHYSLKLSDKEEPTIKGPVPIPYELKQALAEHRDKLIGWLYCNDKEWPIGKTKE